MVHPVRAPGRAPPPPWLAAAPERAVEALVLRTAGEGWRIGASCPVPEWRDGWAGYAELGAVAWDAVADLNAPIDADAWTAMERALHQRTLAKQRAQGERDMGAVTRDPGPEGDDALPAKRPEALTKLRRRVAQRPVVIVRDGPRPSSCRCRCCSAAPTHRSPRSASACPSRSRAGPRPSPAR